MMHDRGTQESSNILSGTVSRITPFHALIRGSRPMPNKSNPVVAMLRADHKKVKELAEYEEADSRKQQTIAETAMQELNIHAELEERLIYPAIRQEIDADDLMNEANEEHHVAHV